MQQAEAMKAPCGELAASCVKWECPIEGYAISPFNKEPTLAYWTQSQGLQPYQGKDAEAIVELGELDVCWAQVRSLPHAFSSVTGCHSGHVIELVPARASFYGGSNGMYVAWVLGCIGGVIHVAHHQSSGAIAWSVAIIET
jgi:hypothetical protein